ncbi:hypothetical protein SAMN04488005_2483 [Yoonia tamlensis]|uniref:Uncharacterized protein n=1 Tax=Yoonia tamlensis TaxID=390270 RepID=A0A1I6HBK2_9RHOB|nr:hypothetical protein [Yoonia tamlensis]SFR51885.1 hypothetical protein SAMN04488005_2483 [Yoonia tamlensis]
MKHVISILLLVLAPCTAMAAPVRVLTGEHAQFTRMVFRIAPGSEWTLGRADDGYMLLLPTSQSYDLQGFFDRIPKDRIAQITQPRAGEFVFDVPCDCRAEAFLVGDDVLVIDVSDGSPLASSPFEQRLDASDIAATPVAQPYVVPENAIFPVFGASPLQTAPPPAPLNDVAVARAEPAPVPQAFDADLSALETSIVASLAQGLTQGVLAQDLQNAGNVAGIDETIRDALRAAHTAIPGIGTRTNQDENARPITPEIAKTQSGQRCLPAAYFDIPNWGDAQPFSTQLAQARSEIVTEVGQPDETAVLRLARTYVYFGFGREALRTLEIDGVRSQERTYLAQIARIIDAERAQQNLFAEQVSCSSSVALWAALAIKDGPMDAQLDRAAVLHAFKALPIHLQRHIGPMLSERFIAIGDHDGALQTLDAGRGADTKTLDATLAEAELDHALGNETSVEIAVATAVRENARITPDVMIAFLTDAVENNREIEDSDFMLADALRFEHAHLPIAGDLTYAQGRGYLMQGNIDQLQRLIAEESDALGDVRVLALNDALASFFVQSNEDAAFLTFAFDASPENYSDDAASDIAARLVELGFPERAVVFVPENGFTPEIGEVVAGVIGAASALPQSPRIIDTPSSVSPPAGLQGVTSEQVLNNVLDAPLSNGRYLLTQSQETRESLATILSQFPAPNDL